MESQTTLQTAELHAIATSSLTRRFGDIAAVDHIDLRIPYGQVFGLLGPNGAGKSTTIKMLTTLLDPSSGTALVAGFDVVKHPAEVRRRIGYVPQMLSADGGLTGAENLILSAKLYGMPHKERSARIKEALRFMGLEEAAKLREWESRRRRRAAHNLRMVQRETVGDAASAIVADQHKSWKTEFSHHLDQFLRHGALGVRKVVAR